MTIEVEHLTFGYEKNRSVLKDVNFCVESGEFLSILGPNGVGKSTLFRCILGMLKQYDGTIRIDGTEIRKLSERELARKVAYIPQFHSPTFNYSVLDMVLMGSANQISSFGVPGREEKEKAAEALEKMGIRHLKDRGFRYISGGEQQLVLMARAILQNARIWIMDEPSANLDYGNQLRVLNQMQELSRKGYTMIQSTHNPDQTFLFSSRVLALKDGAILADGIPNEVMTAGLIRELYQVDVEVSSLRDGAFRVCVPRSLC